VVPSLPRSRRERLLAAAGSAALLAAPAVFTAAFFVEPAPERLERPLSLAGVALALLGTVLVATLASRRRGVGG